MILFVTTPHKNSGARRPELSVRLLARRLREDDGGLLEVLIVEKLPLLGSGKIDYTALQSLVNERVKLEAAAAVAS